MLGVCSKAAETLERRDLANCSRNIDGNQKGPRRDQDPNMSFKSMNPETTRPPAGHCPWFQSSDFNAWVFGGILPGNRCHQTSCLQVPQELELSKCHLFPQWIKRTVCQVKKDWRVHSGLNLSWWWGQAFCSLTSTSLHYCGGLSRGLLIALLIVP